MDDERFSTQRYSEMRHLRSAPRRLGDTNTEHLTRRFARTAEVLRAQREAERREQPSGNAAA